jgi:hypothetical protein
MSEPKIRLERMGVFGRTRCDLVYLDDENIGRVIGETVNTKITWWKALAVASPDRKPFMSEGFLKRQEAVDALVTYWQKHDA